MNVNYYHLNSTLNFIDGCLRASSNIFTPKK